MDSINVELGERSYPIYIGSRILKDFGTKLREFVESKKVAVVTNPTVSALYLENVNNSLVHSGFEPKVIEIPDGEEFKSLKWAEKIFDKLVSFEIDRQTPLVALGGGVVGDITGFAAASYLRGIPYVQVPTTLLAQVDSSVGGKTAVNHRKGKNLIGAFYQPRFVFIDVDTLKTLEKRELRAGLSEVIKYGVIKDTGLFEYLEKNMESLLSYDEKALTHIIKRSCEIKAEVVEADERESGLRAILNFGHTFGHAVEALTKYKKFKHGEAVAIGMIWAANLSNRLGLCSLDVVERIDGLIKKTGLPGDAPAYSAEEYIRAMKLDKKVIGGDLRFVLTEAIGKVDIKTLAQTSWTNAFMK